MWPLFRFATTDIGLMRTVALARAVRVQTAASHRRMKVPVVRAETIHDNSAIQDLKFTKLVIHYSLTECSLKVETGEAGHHDILSVAQPAINAVV